MCLIVSFNDRCCWHCELCHDFEYRKSEYECKRCPEGMIRNQTAPDDCRLAPELYLDYTNPWALGALFFAGTGLIMTTISTGDSFGNTIRKILKNGKKYLGVLWKYWNTPVVRACSRELSCVLIIGTFLSFSTTFIIVAKPSDFTCGVMRFLIGFCYTLCYAAVVTKTNRVSRIFSAASQPACTSPTASVVISLLLTLVEVRHVTLDTSQDT